MKKVGAFFRLGKGVAQLICDNRVTALSKKHGPPGVNPTGRVERATPLAR